MSTLKEEQESLKVKVKKPSLKRDNDKTYKLVLNKEGDAIQESKTEELSEEVQTGGGEIVRESSQEEEQPQVNLIEEISEEVEETTTEEEIEEDYPITPQLPENVEKLVDFMKTTGGNIEDYVRLNADYSNVDDVTLLKEYYAKTKPHLSLDEINFLLEDKFAWDEDLADEREIKKKKLAAKEEVAKGKLFLEDLKNKYYDEIKMRPGVTQDQQKAMDFFNRYNKEQEVVKQQHEEFVNKTKTYFDDFKGFEMNVSGKKFRYGVTNPESVAEKQSNLNSFLRKFLDDKGNVKDHVGYHKAIYAAGNVDTIAEHFYEQGKADAIKDITAKSNNVKSEARPTPSGDVYINGLKVKAISGVDSSKLKIKHKPKI